MPVAGSSLLDDGPGTSLSHAGGAGTGERTVETIVATVATIVGIDASSRPCIRCIPPDRFLSCDCAHWFM